MPQQPNISISHVTALYKKAGIDLSSDSTALIWSPICGEGLPVSWTDNLFVDGTWRERTPNPASPADGVTFRHFPDHHAWTARFLIWAMENADSSLELRKAKVRTGSSARSKLSFFKPLVVYMQGTTKRCILDLTQEDLRVFMFQWCGLTEGRTPVKRDRALEMVIVLRQLYHLGPAGDYWIPDGLSFDPQPSLVDIANHSRLRGRNTAIDFGEDAAHCLISTAIFWVEELASPLSRIRLMLDGLPSSESSDVNPATRAAIYARIRANPGCIEDYAFLQTIFPRLQKYSLIRRAGQTSQAAHPKTSKIEVPIDTDTGITKTNNSTKVAKETTKRLVFRNSGNLKSALDVFSCSIFLTDIAKIRAELRSLSFIMTGMCYVVVAAFTGWRISEILSVERGFLSTLAGGMELGSKIRKTGVNFESVTHRPVPPIVGKVVHYLETMNAEHFEAAEKRIFRRLSGTTSDTDHIGIAIKRACKQVGLEVKVNSHRFRHFFAVFYLRRFQGNIDALRRNFRHVSRDMIWSYARDVGNAKYLARAEKRLAIEIAEGIIMDKGFRSRQVAEDIRVQYKALNLPPLEAERWLRQELERDFHAVHPMPFGYCLFQKNNSGAACEAKDGPVLARAEPSTCGGCSFFASGEENIGFWQTTALLHKEIVESDYHTPILKSSSRKLLKVCYAILERHNAANASSE